MTDNDVEAIYPLSPMQQGMLFHSIYEPGAGVYLGQHRCEFEGRLNTQAFKRAWQMAVDRHPALRTLFVWEGRDRPLQVVWRRVTLPWQEHDLSLKSPDSQEEWIRDYFRNDRQENFNLSKAPLMRLSLFLLGNDAYTLVWTHHHLLLDGWSGVLVVKDVLALYKEACDGLAETRLKQVHPYRDYIVWLNKQNARDTEKFWRERLKGLTGPTTLAVERTVPEEKNGRSVDYHTLKLSASLSERLRGFARSHRLTPNDVFQGAWALLLARYTGKDDVLFGAVVSGRPPELPGVETMVGVFINTIPIRIHITQESSVAAWLKAVQTGQIEARQYVYASIADVQRWSEIPPRTPLFESILVFQNYPASRLGQEGQSLRMKNVEFIEQPHYPLSLLIMPSQGMLKLFYDRRSFEPIASARMLYHLQRLLESVVHSNASTLSELRMLSEAEVSQVVEQWNDTYVRFEAAGVVHGLFDKRARICPDSIALVCEGCCLSYNGLNRRANQIAHLLLSRGISPDLPVGLYLERSVELVSAIIGVLKAGAAYLPLDPDYPIDRITLMLRDSATPVITSTEALLDRLPSLPAQVVALDGEGFSLELFPDTNPAETATDSNLAYIIYTSGSTGTPKGVMITHASLRNLALAQIEAFRINAESRVLQFAATGFDASVSEIFTTLLEGACLILSKKEAIMPGGGLESRVEEEEATVATLPPSVFSLLDRSLPQLTTLVSAGEPCTSELVSKWTEGRLLLNAYGPTEGTVCSTIGTCSQPSEKPSIGRAISNTQIYVLDPGLRPCAVGSPGQLHLGGAGVSRGYLHAPDLTAAKFIPDSLSGIEGSRLYASGDRGRWLADGNLDFLGRFDSQVKLRGFRIELGEIEAVLATHTAVREAAVAVKEPPALAAYVVLRSDEEPGPSLEALRRYLAARLPDYMVPSDWVAIERLPLTPNNKVDRRALLSIDLQKVGLNGYVPPRNPVERVLCQIWSSVLNAERVGVHDDFLLLGGHSLLAVQMTSRMKKILKIEVPLHYLYENPTVAMLADSFKNNSANWPHLEKVARVFEKIEGMSDAEMRQTLLHKKAQRGEVG